jgi:hypothetical protein
MKKFRELFIKVDSQHTTEFVAALDSALTAGWARAHDAEERGRSLANDDAEFCYYYCDKRDHRQAAMISIYRRDGETLYVTNVVPTELTELSHEQYNAILQNFHDLVLTKLNVVFPITILLASDQLNVANMMSAEAFKRLQEFSSMANKSTGSSHPHDRGRWIEFLQTLHSTKHRFDSHSLVRWLTEVEEWPVEVAHEMQSEFEFAMELLDYGPKS